MTDWDEISDPPRYYDRGGRAISLREWSTLFDDDEYKIVEHTVVADRWLVSTVWLGLEHGFAALFDPSVSDRRPEAIFETMVFDKSSDQPYHDWEMRRYGAEAEARRGHADMVELVKTLDQV